MNQNTNPSAVIEEISPEEAASVFGGSKARYEVIVSKLVGNKVRRVKRIVTRKALTRLIRLKSGKYTVKYKAVINRHKTTVSHGNSGFRPANNFF
ncbi:hypothetical protein [Gimesia chilikensis]|uniref:hypothetical protein n=1 Tax=Gimesia chilikensis TaxID=2605989 RepID=UPI000C599F3F|nr:hypothetical protein [Gimesia chilikensis]MBN71866.1 hypothetical protein [Gimesia sp.]MCR9232397.1 hypothetical protein [bacterium]QDT85397.1 hypothetical protein MalM14_30650 [Gimesia chilikensis]